jgi:hypothetical protein
VGRPETLFQAGVNPRTGGGYRGYDVINDGERFLFRVQETSAPVTVVLNWTAVLED